MATLAVVDVARAGTDTAGVAAAGGGDAFPNTGAEFLMVWNGGGSPINVTIATQATADGKAIADDVVAVPNADWRLIGPFPRWLYNDANGRVVVTYSGTTSVSVAVRRLTPQPA